METVAGYTNAMREQAMRIVAVVHSEHPHETSAPRHVAGLLVISHETLRLRHEFAELKRGNEILKSASVFNA